MNIAGAVLSVFIILGVNPVQAAEVACPVGFICTPIVENTSPLLAAEETHCHIFEQNLSFADGAVGGSLEVRYLQLFLNEKGFNVKDDIKTLYYGFDTYMAVKAYQKSVGLQETGFFNTETREMVNARCASDDHEEMDHSVTIISPNGGETFVAGGFLTGSFSVDNIPSGTNYEIALVGDNYDKELAYYLTNGTGNQPLTLLIPDNAPAGDHYKLEIEICKDANPTLNMEGCMEEFSDGYFTITNPNINNNNNSGNHNGGGGSNSNSNSNDTSSNGNLTALCTIPSEIYLPEGVETTDVEVTANITGGSGRYSFTPYRYRGLGKGEYHSHVHVVDEDSVDKKSIDMVCNYEIEEYEDHKESTSSIVIVSPKTEDKWNVGETYPIIWTAPENVTDVRMYLVGVYIPGSKYDGTDVRFISSYSGTSHSYPYNVSSLDLPVAPGYSERLLVCDGPMQEGEGNCGSSGKIYVVGTTANTGLSASCTVPSEIYIPNGSSSVDIEVTANVTGGTGKYSFIPYRYRGVVAGDYHSNVHIIDEGSADKKSIDMMCNYEVENTPIALPSIAPESTPAPAVIPEPTPELPKEAAPELPTEN